MFLTPTRRWGGAALLLAGLAAGCRHTHDGLKADGCDSCAAKEVAVVPAPPPPARLAKIIHPPAKVECLPPVKNERYCLPTRPEACVQLPPPPAPVVAAKPDEKTLPPAKIDPAVTIPAVAGTAKSEEPPLRRSFPDITARPEFSHTPDYSTLTGELSFVPQRNQWRLRYASIDEEDRYGGSVTLDSQTMLRDYKNGQLVRVRGALVDKESRDPAPMYRVVDVTAVKK